MSSVSNSSQKMAINICANCLVCSKAPRIGGITKSERLSSSVDIYEYGKTSRGIMQASESETAYRPSTAFHHYETAVSRKTVFDELNKFKTECKCVTRKCILKRIRVLLTELSQINLSEVLTICEHCKSLAEGVKCERCQNIKFKCGDIQGQLMEHQRRRLNWLSKMRQLYELLDFKSVPGLLKDAYDFDELRRILNEIYQPVAPRTTPKLCDWASASFKLYENKEIFQRILNQIGDEGVAEPSGIRMLGDANLGAKSLASSQQLPKVPDNTPARTIKTTTESRFDVKTSEKTATWKVPSIRRKITQGLSKKAEKGSVSKAQSARTMKSKEGMTGKNQRKSIVEEKTEISLPEGLKSAFTYQLSDRRFIDNGWTVLPTLRTERMATRALLQVCGISREETAVEKKAERNSTYYICEMIPVFSDDDWMTLNKYKGIIYYDTGEIMAVFKETDEVTWYYKNGMVALVYNGPKRPEGKDNGNQFMYVLYSLEVDMRKKQTVLAKFDYCGNGVVYDHQGNERLKYNQNSGKLFNRKGTAATWLWHNLNEPATYRETCVDTYVRNPDPVLTEIIEKNERLEKEKENTSETENKELAQKEENERMTIIEMENDAKVKETFQMYTIRMKRIIINERFSLKLISQSQIYLMFCDRPMRFRLNLGLEMNPKVSRKEYVVVE